MRLMTLLFVAFTLAACTAKKPASLQGSEPAEKQAAQAAESTKATESNQPTTGETSMDAKDIVLETNPDSLRTANGLPLNEPRQQFSYMIGGSIGSNFKKDDLDLDLGLVMEGMSDAVNANMTLSPMQMTSLMRAFQTAMQEKAQLKAQANLAKSASYLEENKAKEGVQVTASGLQYKVLKKGNGTEHPLATSEVTVHYAGRLVDGTEFDSSIGRGEPSKFVVNQVISGWTEGLQLMSVGDSFEFTIPANLAYGERAQGQIPANSILIFEVSLIDFK